MIHKKIDKSNPKGWFVGPWNSKLQIPIGYANQGINEPHLHTQMHEIYLVAKGWSKIQVGKDIIKLEEGDLIVVEPNESHTFLENSSDYFHFVLQSPFVKGDKKLL